MAAGLKKKLSGASYIHCWLYIEPVIYEKCILKCQPKSTNWWQWCYDHSWTTVGHQCGLNKVDTDTQMFWNWQKTGMGQLSYVCPLVLIIHIGPVKYDTYIKVTSQSWPGGDNDLNGIWADWSPNKMASQCHLWTLGRPGGGKIDKNCQETAKMNEFTFTGRALWLN